jgi:hypothetical protein
MPFIQGKRPAITLHDPKDLIRLTEALCAAGYEKHGGLRITRRGELLTFKKRFEVVKNIKRASGFVTRDNVETLVQQNHVQVVAMPDNTIGIFGHVEPYGYGWRHFWSGVCNRANFGAGATMLRKDLREHGYKSV